MKSYTRTTNHLFLILSLMLAVVLTACGSAALETAASDEAAAPAEPQVVNVAKEKTVEEQPAQSAAESKTETQTEVETSGTQTFHIVPEQSEARFQINEVLRGEPKTVIGVTSQVTGEIMVDPANPATATVSTIQIDARDFKTDSDRRNGAIQRFILQTSQAGNESITFAPTSIEALPESAVVGQSFQFQISGDLTINGTTQPATFAMTVTPTSESELAGSGSTTVAYADFGLSIPSVPFVASVEDEVILEIDFVAAVQ